MRDPRTTLVLAGLLLGAVPLGAAPLSQAQTPGLAPDQPDASHIQHALDGLGVVGTVLYVAAHPDDENTRLLAYLANGRHVRTVYLSLTRGDGGQNLIGEEQDELFGVIRTHELMAARRLDGAEQLFTRARDFGYSKSADETLAKWGHEAILADIVWAIRRVRPDVVLTRFATDGPPNHGHHTASAILAAEAFEAAADPGRFPEQLAYVEPWQADRLIYNVSHWLITPETDTSPWLKLDVGTYDPLLGVSYGELAGRSRSMHKSQGFGAPQERGPIVEYFQPLAGTRPAVDVLDGLALDWRRFPGAETLAGLVEAAARDFDPRAPHRTIPALLAARAEARKLSDETWKRSTVARIDALVAACAGLYVEATADRVGATPGETVPLSLEATNRAPVAIRLVSVTLPDGRTVAVDAPLAPNGPLVRVEPFRLPDDTAYTAPYWLRAPAEGDRYAVADPRLVGLPVNPPALPVTFTVEVGGETLTFVRDVVYKWVDLVEGERRRPFEVGPPATVRFERDVLLLPNRAPRTVRVTVGAGRKDLRGAVRLVLPSGWRVAPASVPVALADVGDETTVRFTVTPPPGTTPGTTVGAVSGPDARAHAEVVVDGVPYGVSVVRIQYPHLPIQTIHRDATLRLVPFDFARRSARVGYVPGPGDKVAESLRDAGYVVDVLSDGQLTSGDLGAWRTIVVGVRAFSNTPRMKVWQPNLLQWVEGGGTLVVQYATRNWRSDLVAPIGPAALTIGRGRVTDETAPVTFLAPDSPLLTTPNRITAEDFVGWVQERGLYFGESWAPAWQPVLAMADPGEAPQEGSVLAMDHGKGRIVYTGLSFFRQLPEGVAGAYRLFANLIDHATPPEGADGAGAGAP